MPLSPAPYAAKKFAEIDGRRMAYIDEGAGEAIVFHVLHPDELQLPDVDSGVFIDSETNSRV